MLSLEISVIMERVPLENPWRTEDWHALGVVVAGEQAGDGPRVIVDDGQCRQVLYPRLVLELTRDECEFYHHNLTSPEPRVFVLRRDDGQGIAVPDLATVSYGVAARWMDAGETVDGVPMPPEIYRWVGEFVEENFRPQPKFKRRRS